MYKYIIMKKNCLNIFYGKEHKESLLKTLKKYFFATLSFMQECYICKRFKNIFI